MSGETLAEGLVAEKYLCHVRMLPVSTDKWSPTGVNECRVRRNGGAYSHKFARSCVSAYAALAGADEHRLLDGPDGAGLVEQRTEGDPDTVWAVVGFGPDAGPLPNGNPVQVYR